MLEKVELLMTQMVETLDDKYILELFEKIPKGKRLRAKLILKIAGLSEDAYKLAAIVELIHAASLLHDDVIDDAMLRRGQESINSIFGDKTSIMLGDILYSTGFAALTALPQNVAFKVSNAVALLSAGELLDVELSKKFNDNEEQYIDMIYKKTASLIEASSASAAMLGGKNVEIYEIYGKNLGLAFQVIDDILDITQDSDKLGKPSLHDFKEGKTTLPYLYLYKRIDADEKKKLLSLFKKDLDEDDRMWIKNRMKETCSLDDSMEYARKLGGEALESIKDEKNDHLSDIITQMIYRDF
ncbi:MAG: polyprenyl synthetase family protein [Epsilonproteobacteria bacterium]|nr:polyprenyl synthetase family protein [Campylobacterota bacterium]